MMKPIVAERTSPTPPKQFRAKHTSRPLGFPISYHRKGRTQVSEIKPDIVPGTISETAECSRRTSTCSIPDDPQSWPPLSRSTQWPPAPSTESRKKDYSLKDLDLNVVEAIPKDELSSILAEVKGSLSESSIKRLIEDGLAKHGKKEGEGTTCETNIPKDESCVYQYGYNEHINEEIKGNSGIQHNQEEKNMRKLDSNLARIESQSSMKTLTGSSYPPEKLAQKKYMFVDRYDLLGRKIIDVENFQQHISTTFTSNKYFKCFTADLANKISIICIDIILLSGFALDSRKCDSMIELYNHEVDQHLPGYSLNEICEVSRYFIFMDYTSCPDSHSVFFFLIL